MTNEHVIDLSSLLLLLHNPVKQLVKGWSSRVNIHIGRRSEKKKTLRQSRVRKEFINCSKLSSPGSYIHQLALWRSFRKGRAPLTWPWSPFPPFHILSLMFCTWQWKCSLEYRENDDVWGEKKKRAKKAFQHILIRAAPFPACLLCF